MMNIYLKQDADPELKEWGIQIPLLKSRALEVCEYLSNKLGKKVGEELNPPLLLKEDLLRVHDESFVDALYDKEKVNKELISCYELINEDGSFHRYIPEKQIRSFDELFLCQLKEASSTYFCAEKVVKSRESAFYLSGGMHHAMSFGGRGFCLLNDIVIASKKLQQQKLVKRIWVIDIDAHKGDGTAELTQNDPSIVTLSIHMANGWPMDLPGEGPWQIESDIEIPIPPKSEHTYIDQLKNGLNKLESYGLPELAIVVDGSDPYELDTLKSSESLNLNLDQMFQRDQTVHHFLNHLNIPQLWLMSGGYGPDSWKPYANFLEKIIK